MRKAIRPVLLDAKSYSRKFKNLKNVRISSSTIIHNIDNFHIANNIFIGHYNFLEASNGITIEEGCQITNFVTITTHSSHISIRLYGAEYNDFKNLEGYVKGDVYIGKYTFVGPHSIIMPNTKIGKGCIVSAYSYVKGEFPDYSIIKGNPAEIVGDTRKLDEKYLQNNDDLMKYYQDWSQ